MRRYLLALAALPLLLGAGYYQWVDENGVVTFSQHAPQGVQAEQLTMGSAQAIGQESGDETDPAAAAPIDLDIDSILQRRDREHRNASARPRSNMTPRHMQCEIARSELAQLKRNPPRVVRVPIPPDLIMPHAPVRNMPKRSPNQPNYTEIRRSDEEIAAIISQAEAAVREICRNIP
jgi:hypothetical protein